MVTFFVSESLLDCGVDGLTRLAKKLKGWAEKDDDIFRRKVPNSLLPREARTLRFLKGKKELL